MSVQLVQYLLTIFGLSFSVFGAVVVLAADWSTMEDVVYEIGNREPILHHIPIIGYPFKSAKNFSHLSELSDVLFVKEQDIDSTHDGFSLIQSVTEDIHRRGSPRETAWSHNIEDTEFESMRLHQWPNPPEAGLTVGKNMYTNLYDNQGNSKGWIRTEVLRQAIHSRLDDLASKSGAGLFAGGFLLQLTAELLVVPESLRIDISPVLLTVVILLLILSIPSLCDK